MKEDSNDNSVNQENPEANNIEYQQQQELEPENLEEIM